MKVKALCGVIYKGELHKAGELFEADTILPNTEAIIINEPRLSSELKSEDTEKPERLSDGNKTTKKRR